MVVRIVRIVQFISWYGSNFVSHETYQ